MRQVDDDDDDDDDGDYGEASHLDADGKPKIVERHLIVPPELAGLRLDHFVKTQIVRLSRTKIQTIIETQLRRVARSGSAGSRSTAAGGAEVARSGSAGSRSSAAGGAEVARSGSAGSRSSAAGGAEVARSGSAGSRSSAAGGAEVARSGSAGSRSSAAGGAEVARSGSAGSRSSAAGGAEVARSGSAGSRSSAAGGAEVVDVDGHAPKPATIVAAGEHYVIRREAKPEPPCPRTFGVVHADARVIVVDKPAGLPVHASAKFYFNTLARVLAERYPDEPELQMCHRLDRETSGCLVVARDKAAAAYVKQAFADRGRSANSSSVPTSGADKARTTKQYLAVVHGQPPWEREHELDAPLRLATEADGTKLVNVRVIPNDGGLAALTRVRVERRAGDYALVRCTLVTGRQHQIRVHLAHAGFPIVGDKLYAHGDDAFIDYCEREASPERDEGMTPELLELFVLPRHALHAAKVIVPHPDGGEVAAEAPLPADMAALLNA